MSHVGTFPVVVGNQVVGWGGKGLLGIVPGGVGRGEPMGMINEGEWVRFRWR